MADSLPFTFVTFLAALFVIGVGGVVLALAVTFILDVTQTRQALRRNFPVIGHFRYLLEWLGTFLRQYVFAMDREEMPFNRAQRAWVYRAAKGLVTWAPFGSTRDLRPRGSILFVNGAFPVLDEEAAPTRPLSIGPSSARPFVTDALFNISAMSYGAISRPAALALSHGARMAGCWLNTGEGGLAPAHLDGGCDLVFQIGTAKYGVRDALGNLSTTKLREVAAHEQVRMFEIKLSQGAKPGKGGILPAVKVTEDIARIRGIPPHRDSMSPNRFPEIGNPADLLDFVARIRDLTGRPVGIKTVVGEYGWLHALFEAVQRRGPASAPDFITLDSADGGTGAAPVSLMDYMGLPIQESLPAVVDLLVAYGLRERIRVIASGKLINPADVAWALCVGADFVSSARGFMFALGCIQALQCHRNTCPTGITTHNPRLQRGLVPEVKAVRVANYVRQLLDEVGVIAHACGVREPRELRREHCRIVTAEGGSIPLAAAYPPPAPGSALQRLAN